MSKMKREISPRNRGILNMLAEGRGRDEIRDTFGVNSNVITSVVLRFADRYLEETGKEVRRERRTVPSIVKSASNKIAENEENVKEIEEEYDENALPNGFDLDDGVQVDLAQEKSELLRDLEEEVKRQILQER